MPRGRKLPSGEDHPLYVLRRDDFSKVFNEILYTPPPFKIREIARKINESDDFVRRRIQKLNELGFKFGAELNERKIGLSSLHVHLKTPYINDPVYRVKGLGENLKWILRWKANIVWPTQYGALVFYVPYREEVLNEISREIMYRLPVTRMFETDVTVSNKPDISTLKFSEEYKIATTDWRFVADKIVEAYKNGVEPKIKDSLKGTSRQHVHIDLLDLLVLAMLQRNAFFGLSDISKELGFSPTKIRRHVERHIFRNALSLGTRLKDYVLRSEKTLYTYMFGKSEPYSISLVMDFLRKTFNFISGAYNSITGEFMMLIAFDSEEMAPFTNAMFDVITRVLGTAQSHLLDRSTLRSYTVPFLTFSRDEKSWVWEVSVIEALKEKLKPLVS